MSIETSYRGRFVTVSGLVDSGRTRADVLRRLDDALPEQTVLRDAITPLPRDERPIERAAPPDLSGIERRIAEARADAEARIASVRTEAAARVAEARREALARATRADLQRSKTRLADARDALNQVRAAMQSSPVPVLLRGASRDDIEAALTAMASAERELDQLSASVAGASSAAARAALMERMADVEGQIADQVQLLDSVIDSGAAGTSRRSAASRTATPPETASDGAVRLSAGVGTLASRAVALAQMSRVQLPEPQRTVVTRPAEPTPRERLIAWTRSHAVFFAEGTSFRAPRETGQLLDELADLLRQSGALVRVIGYTDETGGANRNSELSQNRAEAVRRALAERGVPDQQLVAIGRAERLNLSRSSGLGSPNRRVEFEVGFVNEINDSGITDTRDDR